MRTVISYIFSFLVGGTAIFAELPILIVVGIALAATYITFGEEVCKQVARFAVLAMFVGGGILHTYIYHRSRSAADAEIL